MPRSRFPRKSLRMYFSGGLIPSYLLVKGLGLVDSRMALIIPGAVSTFNLMIMITGFEGIPKSLEEPARIDGAGDLTILGKIIVPLPPIQEQHRIVSKIEELMPYCDLLSSNI